MTKTMRVLGLATALVTGIAGASFAAGGSLGSQNTTETQLNRTGHDQMVPKPANRGAQAVPGTGTYGMNGNSTTSTYSGAVNSPTTPDAKNPSTATSPSGGGGNNGR